MNTPDASPSLLSTTPPLCLTRTVLRQERVPLPFCRPSLSTCINLFNQMFSSYFVYFLNQITIFPQRCPLSLLLKRPPPLLAMNVNPDAVLYTFLRDTRYFIPCMMASVSFGPESVYLQMEEIKQDIQNSTSNYLVNIPVSNTNLIDTSDDTIKYIKVLLQAHHSYPGPITTPISNFPSPDA